MSFFVITNPTFDTINQVVEGWQSSPYADFETACDWAASGYADEACVVNSADIMTPLFWAAPQALTYFLEETGVRNVLGPHQRGASLDTGEHPKETRLVPGKCLVLRCGCAAFLAVCRAA